MKVKTSVAANKTLWKKKRVQIMSSIFLKGPKQVVPFGPCKGTAMGAGAGAITGVAMVTKKA
jgi:hypothetical protein